jgi:hypothetical protein
MPHKKAHKVKVAPYLTKDVENSLREAIRAQERRVLSTIQFVPPTGGK